MTHHLNQLSELSRRKLMLGISKMSLGISAMGLPSLSGNSTVQKPKTKVVQISLPGGMSHLDSFDPKPESPEVMGETKVIHSNTDQTLSSHFPRLAKMMDKFTLIRSMISSEGDHVRGRYLMRTSYPLLGTIKHPDLGSWMQRLNGVQNNALPASVGIGSAHGSGFLGAQYDPFVVNNASNGLKGLVMENPKSKESMEMLKLMSALRTDFHKNYRFKGVDAYAQFYNDSLKLMHSDDLAAFDIKQESKSSAAKYKFSGGEKLLLARRLLEANVQHLTLSIGSWDHHNNLWEPEVFASKADNLDKSLATFLQDLYDRGMYKDTVVSIISEFGRTPKINSRKGRDHHRKSFFGILAGTGVKNGTVYGKTNEKGSSIVENPVNVIDFNATLAHLAGLDVNKEIYSSDNRPFTVARGGRVINDLLI